MKLKVNYLSKWLLVVLAVGLCQFAIAQRTITGKVTDESTKEPLIGANILVVGTSTGTITDFDGSYSLTLPSGAAELEFSYTGYTSKRVAIGTASVMDVTLSAGEVLEEVVVVGYGTQKAKEVTSAVTSVKAEDFNAGNVNSPAQLIQGKVAGLSISKVGSDPNGGSQIRLRGLSTLGANTSPLVVIDGVIGATIESVDPNDIASIDVLKDGSAAAIYGSRASSGVILITTKKGAKGATKVEYNGYGSTESISRQVQTMSPSEFAATRPQSDRGFETDWVDEVTRNAMSHVHNLSLSGGIGATSYRASLNYRNIQGIALNSDFSQLNGRLNLVQKAFDDRLTFDISLAATDRDASYGFYESLRYAVLYNPTAPVNALDPTSALGVRYGGYYQEENFDYFNPVAIANQGVNEGSTKDLLLSGRATYELLDGLTASAFYSQLRESELYGQYYEKTAYFRGIGRNGRANRSTVDRLTSLFELTGNFTRQFGNLGLNILAGYSYQDIDESSFNTDAGNFISDDLGYNRINYALEYQRGLASVNTFRSAYKVIGFFGRVNLNIDDTYYLMASLRREGSTRFGENNKWGLFPAVSAGVTLSNLFDISSLDNLKLRVGYGETGALPPFNGISKLRFERSGNFFYNGNFIPAFGPTQNANPDLKWETKGEFNAGLDFAFLDYKLTGSLDYYVRNTRDLIYPINVPVPPNLASTTWANLEDVVLRNSGFEASLGYNVTGSGFTWEPRLVFATYKTVLDTVDATDAKFKFFTNSGVNFEPSTSPGAPGLNNNPTVAIIAGEELGQLWGYKYLGVGDDGKFIFEDLDGDGQITSEDQAVIGSALPKFSLGLNNTFRFGKLDVNLFIRGDFGHELMNMYRVFYEPLGTGSREIENIVKTKYFDENLKANPQVSSHYVEKADYVALDNATVGYTFDLGSGSKINRLRVYLSGQNLFYITGYSGVDPSPRYADPGETDNGGDTPSGNNVLAPGLDRRNIYFLTRTFTLGVNLGF
ncbi:MAG: SusC/RagA family TonB-linked outer membrane protein [Saprospiraceae bacterium]|nr:SusC/RagA family TonB-linked outer membrane protein [Saprospiraceae bacterium]